MYKRFIDICFGEVYRYGEGFYTKRRRGVMLIVYVVTKQGEEFFLHKDQIGMLPCWEPYKEFEVVGELSRED